MKAYTWILIVMLIATGCRKDPFVGPYPPFFLTFQGDGNLVGRDVISHNGGREIVVCGYGKSPNGDDDFFLFFLDSAGNELSRKFVGTTGNDQCWSFVKSGDGGYVIAGWTDVNNPGISNDVLIVKTDKDGNLLWTKIYGGSYNDLATHIANAGDGFIVSAIKGGNADENSWLLRLNNDGDTAWTFTYGGNANDGAMSVCDNHDNTYAVTGYTNSSGNGSTDDYILLLDDAGAMIAYSTFGTSEYEEPHDIERTNNGWVISGHAGTTDFHTHDVFLQFIGDDLGDAGMFTYGDHDHDGAEAMTVFENRICIAARSASRDPNQDVFYVETDAEGHALQKQWIGTPNEDPAFGLYVDAQQILIVGYAVNPTTGRQDLLVLRK